MLGILVTCNLKSWQGLHFRRKAKAIFSFGTAFSFQYPYFCLEKNLTGFIYSSAVISDFRMVINSLCKMEMFVSYIIVLINSKCQSYLFLFLVMRILSEFLILETFLFLLSPLFFCQKTIFFVKREIWRTINSVSL